MRARSSLASIRPTRDVVGSAEIVADEILEDDAHVSAQRTEIVLSQIVATPRTARTREMLGVDCSKMDGPTVPIVYSVSFADPGGYFLATKVQMHNKDVIFAANAQAVGVEKFANFLNTVLSVPSTVATTGNNFALWPYQ